MESLEYFAVLVTNAHRLRVEVPLAHSIPLPTQKWYLSIAGRLSDPLARYELTKETREFFQNQNRFKAWS